MLMLGHTDLKQITKQQTTDNKANGLGESTKLLQLQDQIPLLPFGEFSLPTTCFSCVLSLLSCWHTHLAVCGHAFPHILHYPTLSSCCLGKILPFSPSPFISSISYPNQVCLCSSLLPKWLSIPQVQIQNSRSFTVTKNREVRDNGLPYQMRLTSAVWPWVKYLDLLKYLVHERTWVHLQGHYKNWKSSDT